MRRRREYLWAYNLDNNRPDQYQLARELQAIGEQRPLAIACVEAIGNRLPTLRGFRLIADRSTRSRANIAMYVRADARIGDIRWTDLRTTWPRTQGPGTHEPRSLLTVVVDDVQVTAVHQQPKGTATTLKGQSEGIDALARLMRRGPDDRLAIALGDFNRRHHELGPGPGALAALVDGKPVGSRIDCAVVRGAKRSRARYFSRVAGVPLMSDHKHALRLEVAW